MTDDAAFTAYAAAQRPAIEAALKRVLKQSDIKARDYQQLRREVSRLVQRGGKRLRPLLYLLAYEGYGGRNQRAALKVAAGLELIHAFLLIHDDIIDRDYYRWGDRNIIGVYFERYNRVMDSREALHASEAQALLAGDMVLNMALQAIGHSGFETATELLLDGHAAVLAVIAGELADMAQSQAKRLPTESDVIDMYALKTSSYSFELPLRLAAISSGQTSDMPLLKDLARHLGIAYQLQDDIASIFDTTADTGKSAAGDLREHKQTVLLMKTAAMATPAQRHELDQLLERQDITDADIAAVQKIMTDSDALRSTRELAAQHLEQATGLTRQLALAAPQKSLLYDLIDMIATR